MTAPSLASPDAPAGRPAGRLSAPAVRLARVGSALIGAEVQAASAYRAQLLVGVFGWVVPLAFMALWRGAAGDGAIEGTTSAQFATYFAVMLVTTSVALTPVIVFGFGDLVHSGQLSSMLLRPHHPLLTLVARAVAQKTYRVPPVLLVFPLLLALTGGTVTDHVPSLVLAPVVCLLGVIGASYLAALVATIAFWMTKSNGVQGLLSGLEWIVGGLVAPVALLPGILPDIVRHQPLWFAGGAPAEMVAGMGHHGWGTAVEALLWIVVLDQVFRVVWRRGLRRYEAVGT